MLSTGLVISDRSTEWWSNLRDPHQRMRARVRSTLQLCVGFSDFRLRGVWCAALGRGRTAETDHFHESFDVRKFISYDVIRTQSIVVGK